MRPTFKDVQVDHSIQTIQRMYECGIDQYTAVCMYHIDQHTAIYNVSYIPNFVSTFWEFRAMYSTIIDVGMFTCSSYKKLSQLIRHSYNLSNK